MELLSNLIQHKRRSLWSQV